MQSFFINITKPVAAINKRIHPLVQKTLIFLCMLGMMIPIMGKYVHKDTKIPVEKLNFPSPIFANRLF